MTPKKTGASRASLRAQDYFFLLMGAVLSGLYMVTAKSNFDYSQMYIRALKLVNEGVWTHFGNNASGALLKHIPGSFLTLLTGAPIWVYRSAYSPNVLLLLMILAALFLFASVLKDAYGKDFRWTPLVVLFWLNTWRVSESVLWNPAYLPFFSVLMLYACYRLRTKKDFWGSLLLVLTVGFCFQIHLSAMILLFAAALLFIKKKIHLSYWGVAVGVILILLSALPYALMVYAHPEQYLNLPGEPSDYNQDHFFLRNLIFVYPLLKTFSYWVRFPTLYFPRNPFGEIKMDWLAPAPGWLLEYPYKAVLFVGLCVSVVIGLWAFFSYIERGQIVLRKLKVRAINSSQSNENPKLLWLRDYFTLFFVASLISTAISPVELNYWQLLLCMPISLLAVYDFFIAERIPRINLYLYFLASMFILHSFFSAMHSSLQDYHIRFHEELYNSFPHFFG